MELHTLEMDGEQKEVYDALFNSAKYIFRISRGNEGENVFGNYSSVLELLLRLRQATCCSSLIKSKRLQAARDILNMAAKDCSKATLTKEEAKKLFTK